MYIRRLHAAECARTIQEAHNEFARGQYTSMHTDEQEGGG
jgi:hypothetical protein